MNTKNNQRARLTRQLLKNAYIKLMCEKETGKISIKEICEGAQVNRSTFYLHYTEPNDILIELEDEMITLVRQSLTAIGALDESSTNVNSYILSFLRYVQRNDDIFRTFLVENNDPHFRRKLRDMAFHMVETAFHVDLPPIRKRSACHFIISGSIELITEWIQNEYKTSEIEMSSILFSLCEGSLRAI